MGLLDDLLGQVLAPPTRDVDARVDAAGSTGSGMDMSKVMIALLPVVLGMLTRGQQRGSSAGFGQAGAGGGLGDILGQVLGGAGRGSGGGLGDLLEHFQRAGFGSQAQSWVRSGRNEPISPEAVEQVFGRGGLAEIARRAGISEWDASRGLSQLMPEVVDRVTPNGDVPDFDSLLASVESLTRRLGR
jgi:uncharacterized protein YidB (DUF937 family)